MKRNDVSFFLNNGYLEFPKILQVEITNRCPLNCPQCYKTIDNSADIDFLLLEKTLREGSMYGLRSVMINGGEPVLYPHFFKLLDLLSELDISANCYISGFGVTDKFVQKIKNYNIQINISLNGSTREINSLSRDGYEYAINAIHLFERNEMCYGINWVARKDNIDDFENMLLLAERYHAYSILVLGNKITQLGNLDAPLHREDLDALVNKIKSYELQKGTVVIEKQRCFTELCALYYNTRKSALLGCPAGVVLCTMDLSGVFYPCSHLNYPEKHKSIYEYWHTSKALRDLRDCDTSKSEPCNRCECGETCRFCKAESLLTHNSFNAGNLGCSIMISRGGE